MEADEFRDHISTVNEQGKRVWIYPKRPKGKLYEWRKITSYFLVAFLFGAPYIKVNQEPLILFNIIDRKFVLFGNIFWPQDLYLFALGFILFIVFIIFFTIIYGRLFCGWVCPQTIFMELIFRRIEYWIEGDFKEQQLLNKATWSASKIAKKNVKHTSFLIVSFLIANSFLAYFIGSEHLWAIQNDDIKHHLGGLISISIFTLVFYGVFAWLREQVCTTICPYGRLQGVLIDRNTMVVAYDQSIGEPRAKIHKGEIRESVGKGNCIDCNHCVQVCPTGIDIRNGTQLECINCSACIDECNSMMHAVGMEENLIRFVSENGIKEKKGFEWTTRVKAYSILLLALIGVLLGLMLTRKDFETEIMRQRGSTYTITDDGMITNIFEISILNKTHINYVINLNCPDKKVVIERIGKKMNLNSGKQLKERFLIKVPNSILENGFKKITIEIYGNHKLIEKKKTKIIGPFI
jgi:cytochrome c oxidase accessory protein FixG